MREPLVRKREFRPRLVIKGSEITVASPTAVRLMQAFDRAVAKARQLALDVEMTAILNAGEEKVQVEGITMRTLE